MKAHTPDKLASTLLHLEPDDPSRLANLCGQLNEHLKHIEKRLGVEINNHSNQFQIRGPNLALRQSELLIKRLYQKTINEQISPELVHLLIQEINMDTDIEKNLETPSKKSLDTVKNDPDNSSDKTKERDSLNIQAQRKTVETRGPNQKRYAENIDRYDINFGIGPAGTGKTYLAVACAVAALQQEQVNRIILVRPAVEAGEKLGFLPGDLNEKVNPYLRPLYDALYEMLGFEKVAKLIDRQVIEIAPLAYMRGRTLNNSFIILDESQNTTREQMKMFLTRIGFGSKAVITGDVTQVDLPKGTDSGLAHAKQVLDQTKGIGFTHFIASDIVRHKLVQRIVEAYDIHEKTNTVEALGNRAQPKRDPS